MIDTRSPTWYTYFHTFKARANSSGGDFQFNFTSSNNWCAKPRIRWTLKMILPVLLFLLHATHGIESGDEYEGDSCNSTDVSDGVCTLLKNCDVVRRQLLSGREPASICGYNTRHDPVFCCPINSVRTTQPAPIVTQNPVDDGRGVIARQKCAEYAKYNYVKETSVDDNGNRVTRNVTHCSRSFVKLIVGGRKAEIWEFPHMAAVGFHTPEANEVSWYCGGTLISENFVLTAAQCTFLSNSGQPKWVRLGDLNLNRSDDGAKPQDRHIAEIIKHPQWNPSSYYHDIALLRLESRVTFNAGIRPACLHTSSTTGTTKAIATGWGSDDLFEGGASNDLLRVTLPLVDQVTCNASYYADGHIKQFPDGVVGEWLICAGEADRDTCLGDSGGPLVIYSKKEYYCMYDVVGITSSGKTCGGETPALYTRVYHYVPWIESIVWG